MVAVIIPTKDDEGPLALTLASLVSAAAEGVLREVIVVDGGSVDRTRQIADGTGCTIVERTGGLGERMREGADAVSRGEWLLFLLPGVVLDPRWEAEVVQFIERATRSGRGAERAAVFRYALDDMGTSARIRQAFTGAASRITGLPHPAQGLLISRQHYRRIGGHRGLGALEDIDLVRRIGRGRIARLRSAATLTASPGSDDPMAGLDGTGAGPSVRRRLSRGLAALRLPTGLLVRLHG